MPAAWDRWEGDRREGIWHSLHGGQKKTRWRGLQGSTEHLDKNNRSEMEENNGTYRNTRAISPSGVSSSYPFNNPDLPPVVQAPRVEVLEHVSILVSVTRSLSYKTGIGKLWSAS